MKSPSSFLITVILIAIVMCSWLAFPFLTYSGGFLLIFLFPLLIFIAQIILTFRFKNKKLLWLLLLNPVTFLPLFNTAKASVNYFSGKPTLVQSCCCAGWEATPVSYENKPVHVDYFDDDCGDWAGSYYYTLHINNFITTTLIDIFGNPIENTSTHTK